MRGVLSDENCALREQSARDDHALNLRGTFVDLQQLGVTHKLFYGVFLGVAYTAKDLNCVNGNLHCVIGGESFGIRADDGGVCAGIEQTCCLKGEQVSCFVCDGHVSEHELNSLVLCDGHTERFALFGVCDRLVQCAAHDTARERTDVGTDRKSTRLNSSHVAISYAVFCLKKKTYTRKMKQYHQMY